MEKTKSSENFNNPKLKMPHCETFKQKIEELKGKAQNIGDLLLKYKETGNEEIAQELDRILKEIEDFKKEYETKVKELLIEWYPKKDRINEFLQNLKINERGGLEIEKLDLSGCNLSGALYLPSLFERIEVLDCYYNRLTSLPELPNGLEKLYCYNNQLTSLPELPDGLKLLHCYGNPLSPETIQRIRSHPNYDPSTWQF
jgi:Leucine-rich repeat (LRR) protein